MKKEFELHKSNCINNTRVLQILVIFNVNFLNTLNVHIFIVCESMK